MKSLTGPSGCLPQLVVRGISSRSRHGILICGGLRLPCALGRSGRSAMKREGDGATPIGHFAVRQAFYRADRMARPRTRLPLTPLRASDGWCDDPTDRNYNRHVRHPYPASAERLWRTDRLYDLILVLGYNDAPRVRGRGSAVFLHVAGPGLAPTEGCIALRRPDLERLMARVRAGSVVSVLA